MPVRKAALVNLQWATSSEENSRALRSSEAQMHLSGPRLGLCRPHLLETVSSSQLDYHFADPAPAAQELLPPENGRL